MFIFKIPKKYLPQLVPGSLGEEEKGVQRQKTKRIDMRKMSTVQFRLPTIVSADGAALVVGDDWVGTVTCVLADDLFAHHVATVAHTDLTWFWFPHIPVRKHMTVKSAARARA